MARGLFKGKLLKPLWRPNSLIGRPASVSGMFVTAPLAARAVTTPTIAITSTLRLVKALRLAQISTIAAANAWLPDYLARHNARFGRGLPTAPTRIAPMRARLRSWPEFAPITTRASCPRR